MLNGQLAQWIDEARQHWQHVMAASGMMRDVLPGKEWVRVAVVAVVTSVVTSQVTIGRLDERITALKNEREIIVRNRNDQMNDIKRDIEQLQIMVMSLRLEMKTAK